MENQFEFQNNYQITEEFVDIDNFEEGVNLADNLLDEMQAADIPKVTFSVNIPSKQYADFECQTSAETIEMNTQTETTRTQSAKTQTT